ncbi:hypothetical protein [Neokomagataea anthophila]|uniref:Uncharacterized protein n=1 Tax=Neokomagataea anthophila TaxID=2826925 RepID=A0ABS5E7Y7_9PROT|nr:hypothetical protein [Neokomagataea anthophila]MBR0560022.1 hypothetical protein [Neokomagataea anthophila]
MAIVTQTPVVAGQPSTATILTLDQSGNVIPIKLLLPPGAPAALPEGLAVQSDLAEFISGTLGMGSPDQAGLGLHWNGTSDVPQMVYGTLAQQYFSSLLATNQAGMYLTQSGNTVAEIASAAPLRMQSFTATAVQNGDTIAFPTAFSSANVQIFITPKTPSASGSWSPPLCGYTNVTQYNFQLGRLFTDGTASTSTGDISVIAVGLK